MCARRGDCGGFRGKRRVAALMSVGERGAVHSLRHLPVDEIICAVQRHQLFNPACAGHGPQARRLKLNSVNEGSRGSRGDSLLYFTESYRLLSGVI